MPPKVQKISKGSEMPNRKSRKTGTVKETNSSENETDESSSSESSSSIDKRVTRSMNKNRGHTRSGRPYAGLKSSDRKSKASEGKKQINSRNTRKKTKQAKSLKTKSKNLDSVKITAISSNGGGVLDTPPAPYDSRKHFSDGIKTKDKIIDLPILTSTSVQEEPSSSSETEIPHSADKHFSSVNKIAVHTEVKEDEKDLPSGESNGDDAIDPDISILINQVMKCGEDASNVDFNSLSTSETKNALSCTDIRLNNLECEETLLEDDDTKNDSCSAETHNKKEANLNDETVVDLNEIGFTKVDETEEISSVLRKELIPDVITVNNSYVEIVTSSKGGASLDVNTASESSDSLTALSSNSETDRDAAKIYKGSDLLKEANDVSEIIIASEYGMDAFDAKVHTLLNEENSFDCKLSTKTKANNSSEKRNKYTDDPTISNDNNFSDRNSVLSRTTRNYSRVKLFSKTRGQAALNGTNIGSEKSVEENEFLNDNSENAVKSDEFGQIEIADEDINSSVLERNDIIDNHTNYEKGRNEAGVSLSTAIENREENGLTELSFTDKNNVINVLSKIVNAVAYENERWLQEKFRIVSIVSEMSREGSEQLTDICNKNNAESNEIINYSEKYSDAASREINSVSLGSNEIAGNLKRNEDFVPKEANSTLQSCTKYKDKFSPKLKNHEAAFKDIELNVVKSAEIKDVILSTIHGRDTNVEDGNVLEMGKTVNDRAESKTGKITPEDNNYALDELDEKNRDTLQLNASQKDRDSRKMCSLPKTNGLNVETKKISNILVELGQRRNEFASLMNQNVVTESQNMIDSASNLKIQISVTKGWNNFDDSDEIDSKLDSKDTNEKCNVDLPDTTSEKSGNRKPSDKGLINGFIESREKNVDEVLVDQSKSVFIFEEDDFQNTSLDIVEEMRGVCIGLEVKDLEILSNVNEINEIEVFEITDSSINSNKENTTLKEKVSLVSESYEMADENSLSSGYRNSDLSKTGVPENSNREDLSNRIICISDDTGQIDDKFILIVDHNNVITESHKNSDSKLNMLQSVSKQLNDIAVEPSEIDSDLNLTNVCQKDKESHKTKDDSEKSDDSERLEKDLTDSFMYDSNDYNLILNKKQENSGLLSNEIILLSDEDNDYKSVNENEVLLICVGEPESVRTVIVSNNDSENTVESDTSLDIAIYPTNIEQEDTGLSETSVSLESSAKSNFPVQTFSDLSSSEGNLSEDLEQENTEKIQTSLNKTKMESGTPKELSSVISRNFNSTTQNVHENFHNSKISPKASFQSKSHSCEIIEFEEEKIPESEHLSFTSGDEDPLNRHKTFSKCATETQVDKLNNSSSNKKHSARSTGNAEASNENLIYHKQKSTPISSELRSPETSTCVADQKLCKTSGGSRNYRDSQKLDMNSSYLHVLNRICEEVQQEMANKLEENEIEWRVKVELLFLYDMIGYKPVGVNRHFMMLLIHNKFSTHINHQISSKLLWDHLDSMYDMAALHESEIIPFPNDEVEFELPEDCHELLRTKCGVLLKKSAGENETNKNSTNSKASKKLTPKLKQNSAPVGLPKSNFASPVLNKPTKNQVSVKSESKTFNTDSSSKSKQELGLSTKMNKVKRSSSPFSGKTVKSESSSMTKEDSPDISVNKKSNKAERGSSPATVKKAIKVDSSVANNSAKKPSKNESSVNGSKPTKTETPDNSVKKIKVDVLNKKSKTASSSEVTSKKLKVDINGIKKKTDENTPKKTSEVPSAKHVKSEVKSSSHLSKGTDAETPISSGSRKSSPVVKVKSSESSKKMKHSRVDESSKKLTPAPKRRRL